MHHFLGELNRYEIYFLQTCYINIVLKELLEFGISGHDLWLVPFNMIIGYMGVGVGVGYKKV